ncbi:hypothetical protein PI124_g18772 [Phytophthora idaei]|nr:hypothetical protein PI126_g11831 [Phytophthora idaei]KAG3236219.1 hypothetical protein PI124_g18772 [Phytophthora idaei]
MPKSGISIRSVAAVASACTLACSHQDDSADQMQMERSKRATLQSTLNTRPINTKRKYEGYPNEFVEWCNEKVFLADATVTKSKLHLFLTERVVGRASKKTQSKIIGGSTMCGYINAIVDLYILQVALKTNSNEHSSSLHVKQLIRNMQAKTTDTRKKNYVDRGIGSLLDEYQSETQFRQLCDTDFSLDDLMGRVAFLVSHYGLLRGENIRDLELADRNSMAKAFSRAPH